MTLKAAQLVPVLDALGDLGDNRLPFLVAVRLKRLVRELREYQEAFTEEIRPFLEEFGDPDTGTVPGENLEDFIEAAEEPLNAEIQVDFEPFTMDQLETIAESRDLDLRPDTLEILEATGIIAA